MIILRRGDHLPTVAVAQSFLNHYLPPAQFLTVDGFYGPKTAAAVARVRAKLRLGHGNAIDGQFWLGLVGRDWQVIESTDLTTGWDKDDEALAPYGQTIHRQYGQSLAVEGVVRDIQFSAVPGRVALIRFHGHGVPGGMIIASGKHGNGSIMDQRADYLFVEPLRRLSSVLGPFCSLELHGCRVGAGPKGERLLNMMVQAVGRPVSAAYGRQYGYIPTLVAKETTFRFEGPTRTICPGGVSIKEWAAGVLTVSRPAAGLSMAPPGRIALPAPKAKAHGHSAHH